MRYASYLFAAVPLSGVAFLPASFERMLRRTIELSFALVLLAGCDLSKQSPREGHGSSAPIASTPKVNEKSVQDEGTADVGFEPVPDSLAHCLEPPHMPKVGSADATNDLPWPTTTCGPTVNDTLSDQAFQEREAVLWPPDAGRTVDSEIARDVAAFVKKKLGFEGPGYEGDVGVGLCCSGSPHICVRVEFPLCSTTSAQIEKAFSEALERKGARSPALGLAIKTWGYVRPRCTPGEPECRPFPYNNKSAEALAREPDRFTLPYDASLPRRVIAPRSSHPGETSTISRSDRFTCDHDGDCVPGCLVWHDRRWPRPMSGALSHALLDAYCGCIEGTCQYFESARPLNVKFEGEVHGWGEHPNPDPRRFIVGFGNGQQVVAARLQRQDMVRHMTYCFLDHNDELPKTIEFSMTISKHRKAGSVSVQLKSPASSDPERCVLRVLREQLFPQPPSNENVSVEGKLSLTLSVTND